MAACGSSGCVSSIVTRARYLSVVLSAAVPHVVTEDIAYTGYFIPKGLCYSLLMNLFTLAYAHSARRNGDWKYMVRYLHHPFLVSVA